MLPKEEYINLLADLFQRGLCLDMVDVNEKQNDPDISDEERFSFMAADEALDRVDLDDLFDNAEALQIPDKYPEFYEYLRELQLERQGDEHGERTIEDAVTDEEVEEGEEEPELEEPHNLSTKDQVLKNIMGGEHTGNQRDSEKYRKGDEMRAGLDEERREALERAAEQERYDNERRMSMESSFEDERREAAARAEEQQRQLESLRKRDLAGSPEETINITNTHDKNKSVDDVSNVVRGNTPDESAKHNEGEALSPKSDRFNKPYDPQSQANEANGRQDASPIYDDTTSEARAHKTRAGGLPVDNVSSMAQANSYKSGMAGIEHTTETRINSTQDGDAKHQFTKPKGHYEQSPHTTNGYAKSDLYITEDINKASHHVFEQKQEDIEQITGHGELNTKSAQDVSHVVKGENYSDLFKQKEDAGDRYDTYNRPKDKSFREKRSDALNGTSESSYVHPPMFNKEDRESINHSGVVEAMSKSKAADATSSDFHPDNSVKKDETRDRYVSDSYESAGQRDAGKTYGNAYGNSEQSSSSPDISGRKSHLYEAEDNLTNRNAERVGPKLRTENTNEDEHTKDEYAASGNSGGKRIERYDVEQHKTASELPRESKSVYGENSSSASDYSKKVNDVVPPQSEMEASESKRYVNDSYGQAGQREYNNNWAHEASNGTAFKPKSSDTSIKEDQPRIQSERETKNLSDGNTARKAGLDLHTAQNTRLNPGVGVDDSVNLRSPSSDTDRRLLPDDNGKPGHGFPPFDERKPIEPTIESTKEDVKKYTGNSYEMAGQRESEYRGRQYEGQVSHGFASGPAGSREPSAFSDKTVEIEKRYEKNTTKEANSSEVISKHQPATDGASTKRGETQTGDSIYKSQQSETDKNKYQFTGTEAHHESQRPNINNFQNENRGTNAVEEVFKNRTASKNNQENMSTGRDSYNANEQKQAYSRDSYESSGQAPISERKKETYGQEGIYGNIEKKSRTTSENRVVKFGKAGNVQSQKKDSLLINENKNGGKLGPNKDGTKIVEGPKHARPAKSAIAGAAAATAVATALAARETAKAASSAAKTAADKAEGMMMLGDTSAMSASELAAYARAVNSTQETNLISGKQIADSYALAGQTDIETIRMNVEQALANAKEIAAGPRPNISGSMLGQSGPASAGITKSFDVTRPSVHTLGIPGVVKNSNFTDVGMFVLKEGNQVTIFRNGKSKKYTVRSDGTIRIDGVVLNVYSVDKDRAFVGWKNAAVYGGKIYTATGTVLDVSTDGSIGTTKTLDGLEFHVKRDVKVNARPMTLAMTMAPSLSQPITDADFVKVGDKFISNKVTESYNGLLYQKALNEGKLSQLIFKQKMVMHSVFRAQVLSGAAANMKGIDLKLDLNTLVANYDKILTSISGSSKQFYQMNVFLENRYLSDIERQYLFDAKAKLKRHGLTENTDTLKELLAGGGLTPEQASIITDYLNVYENTREKIIRKGVLGDQSAGEFKVERAFYAAALPYVLQARGLPSDKKALKKLLNAETTSKETKELIRNVFKLQRRMFLLNLTETTLKAYAKGAVKTVKNGYRKIKSLANRYMGDDYTMRGLLMMESIIVGSAMKAYRTARKVKWMRDNAGRLLNSSIRLGKSIGNAAVAGYRGAKAGVHAVHMGGRAARRGFRYLRKNGLKKTLKKGAKKIRMKGTKVARKGVLKVAKATQKAAIKAIQAAIKLIQTLISALLAALGPLVIALIIVLAIILCIISYVKNVGNEVYYDAGDEETAEVLQEMVDVLTLCHSSFRSELSNHFGGTSSTGSASGTDGSTMNAPQLQKGDSSKVQGLYDVAEGTWWNYEFTYQYIHGNWASGTRQQALDNKVTVEGNGNYAVVDQNGTKMYMAAFGSYWGKVGDVLKVEFNNEFAIGNQPASNTMYIIIADEKAWKDTGYPAEQEGIYGHHLGSHRDFAEFIGYDAKPAGLNGQGLIPVTATNMGSILDGTFDSSTIGTGAAASSASVNADIIYRQEIDQDVYRDILNRDKNIYYTFPEEQKVPDGITPTPTPKGYIKEEAKGEVYGFYNNNQELISMVMAMFDFEASSSTSTKSTIISKIDASGYDEAKTNNSYQRGMTSKEIADKWKLIEYLNEKGLDLTNYKAGGYDDLRYSALIGLFNASHIITGTAVKQYHAGPDGTINPVYNDEGRIVGQNNTDGMSYQVPVMETKTRQVKDEHGDIQIVYYTGYKTDADGNIVYETKYAPCPGHTKYSGAVITLHFDSLLNLDSWWKKNIYDVDDFDKENPNYESNDASSDTYRAKENTLKRTIQYIKKPDYYKSLSGTCSEGENSTTDSFNPGTWDGDQAKVAKEVYEFLTTKMSRKLTSEQAIGVLVNIYRECSFNYTEEETGGTGYGLTQWSFGRRTKLVQWCNANGYQYNTLEGQLKRLECEFTEDTSDWSPNGVEGFYACTTAREAGEFFITNYERPNDSCKAQRLAEMNSDIAAIQAMLQS